MLSSVFFVVLLAQRSHADEDPGSAVGKALIQSYVRTEQKMVDAVEAAGETTPAAASESPTEIVSSTLASIIKKLLEDGLDAKTLHAVQHSLMDDVKKVQQTIAKLRSVSPGCTYTDDILAKMIGGYRDLFKCNADPGLAANAAASASKVFYDLPTCPLQDGSALKPAVDCMLLDLTSDWSALEDVDLAGAVRDIAETGNNFSKTGEAEGLLYPTLRLFVGFYQRQMKFGPILVSRVKKAVMVYMFSVLIHKAGNGEIDAASVDKVLELLFFENILWAVKVEETYGTSDASKVNVELGKKMLMFIVSCAQYEKAAPVVRTGPERWTQHMIHWYTLWNWKFVKWLYAPGSPFHPCPSVVPQRYALNAVPNLAWPIFGAGKDGGLWLSNRVSALMAQIRYLTTCEGKLIDLAKMDQSSASLMEWNTEYW